MDEDRRKILSSLSTATITTLLLKSGVRRTWMKGPRRLRPGNRLVGPAFTLRFIPGREDLANPAAWTSPSSSRAAIERVEPGSVAVVAAGGIDDCGILGDILCARLRLRGVAGLVSDGPVRDAAGVIATGLPVWARGAAAPPSIAGLTFVGCQEPVGCGGVAVLPGDIIVADDDGAVVIPKELVDEIIKDGPAQEELEAWILKEVEEGQPLPGLYPPDEAAKARFAARTPPTASASNGAPSG
ncbi:ribonuclease activity regulator RraA [Rhodoligotrophos defluvii]|uniref:ribonuclease activity regulator RraA n=1 Tax=Rhodoligotrophos defluvii TaxID=2561934 RepID=UPI0010C94405|nr:ribonuclease activity regulator RraA [Rhodoligotrophos defluvii]